MPNLEDLRIDLPAPKPGRRRSTRWGLPAFALLTLGGLLILFGGQLTRALGSKLAAPRAVQTIVVAHDGTESASGFTAGGYLEAIPPGPVVVSALIGGRVATLDVIPGQEVEAGDVVATLDDAALQQQVQVQESQVDIARHRLTLIEAGFRSEEIEQAEADLLGHQAELAQVEAEFRRSEALYRESVISKQQQEEVRSRYKQAIATHQAATSRLALLKSGSRREDIALARAELEAAQVKLDYINWEIAQCVIRAPAGGVIAEQFAQPGAWVEPGTDDRHSSALVSIFDPSRIQAWVDVNQRDSAHLFVGQAAYLSTDAHPSRRIAAEVIQIMPVANLQKNTVQAKLAIAEPPSDFRPELSVKIEFLPRSVEAKTPPEEEGFRVPATALARKGEQNGLFLVREGKARWQRIEVSGDVEEAVLVTSGLTPGAVVVVNPSDLRDGQAVATSAGGGR